MNRRHIILPSVLLVLLLTVLIGCERPPLWVSSDEYKQVELDVDWSHADAEPGGMTASLQLSADLTGPCSSDTDSSGCSDTAQPGAPAAPLPAR